MLTAVATLVAPAAAQRQFEELGKRGLPPNQDAALANASGDVDRDGDLDLVIGNGGQRQSRLYLNNGTGTFTDATAARLPAGNSTVARARSRMRPLLACRLAGSPPARWCSATWIETTISTWS